MLKLNIEDVKPTLKETEFPTVVLLESSTYCNLRCVMCPQAQITRKNKVMDFGLFQKAADEIASENKACEIWFGIMGEPLTTSGELLRMLQYAKSLSLEHLHLSTNGCLLTPEISEKLLDSGLESITIGIDAIDAGTFGKIRQNGDFLSTVDAVTNLLAINEEKKRPVRIILQFIAMDENEGQEEAFKEFWLPKGACVKIRPKIGWGTACDSKQLQLDLSARDFPCPFILRNCSIHVDGAFALCGSDWDVKYNLANLKDRTIKSVWNNELKKLRQKHWDFDFEWEPCRDCNDWRIGRSYFYDPEPIKK